MKRTRFMFIVTTLFLLMTACGNSNEPPGSSRSVIQTAGADKSQPVEPGEIAVQTAGAGGEKGWYTDWNAGISAAKSQGKPVIVDFYADWCMWCKVMDEKTFSAPEIKKKFDADWITIRIDTMDTKTMGTFKDKTMSYRELAGAFRIQGLPSYLFISRDGEPVGFVRGYREKDEFSLILDYYKNEIYKKKITFPDYKKSRT